MGGEAGQACSKSAQKGRNICDIVVLFCFAPCLIRESLKGLVFTVAILAPARAD